MIIYWIQKNEEICSKCELQNVNSIDESEDIEQEICEGMERSKV